MSSLELSTPVAVTIMVGGLALALTGLRFYKLVLFFYGAVFGFAAGLIFLITQVLPPVTTSLLLPFSLAISGGSLALRRKQFGYFITGLVLGNGLSASIYSAIAGVVEYSLALVIISTVAGLLTGYFAMHCFRPVIILCSAYTGSGCVALGIASLLDNFSPYLVAGITLGLTFAGTIVQSVCIDDLPDEDEAAGAEDEAAAAEGAAPPGEDSPLLDEQHCTLSIQSDSLPAPPAAPYRFATPPSAARPPVVGSLPPQPFAGLPWAATPQAAPLSASGGARPPYPLPTPTALPPRPRPPIPQPSAGQPQQVHHPHLPNQYHHHHHPAAPGRRAN